MSAIFWITGLSGSGKTTLGKALYERLNLRYKNIVFLDGDILRNEIYSKDTIKNSHSRESRLSLAKRYVRLCKLLYDQNLIVIISTISLFKEIQKTNRELFSNYCEIFLDIDLKTLKKRDPKNLYKKFSMGKIQNITGLDLEADFPNNPEFTFNSSDSLKGLGWLVDRVIKFNKVLK